MFEDEATVDDAIAKLPMSDMQIVLDELKSRGEPDAELVEEVA